MFDPLLPSDALPLAAQLGWESVDIDWFDFATRVPLEDQLSHHQLNETSKTHELTLIISDFYGKKKFAKSWLEWLQKSSLKK